MSLVLSASLLFYNYFFRCTNSITILYNQIFIIHWNEKKKQKFKIYWLYHPIRFFLLFLANNIICHYSFTFIAFFRKLLLRTAYIHTMYIFDLNTSALEWLLLSDGDERQKKNREEKSNGCMRSKKHKKAQT